MDSDYDQVAPVLGVSCRSTTCKVEVGISEKQQIPKSVLKFAVSVLGSEQIKDLHISSVRDSDAGTVNVFLTDLERGQALYSNTQNSTQ